MNQNWQDNEQESHCDPQESLQNRLNKYLTQHQIFNKRHIETKPTQLINLNLFDYQIDGINWILNRYEAGVKGCILADEMGLGKTIQILGLLAYLVQENALKAPVLIMVPLTILRTIWEEHFKSYFPSIPIIVYHGNDKESCLLQLLSPGKTRSIVILTSYEVVLNSEDTVLSSLKYQLVIVDEAHRLKNSKSKLYSVFVSSFHFKFLILLSGSPISNSIAELHSLLYLVAPSVFKNAEEFINYYIFLKSISSSRSNSSSYDNSSLSNWVKHRKLTDLHNIIQPFILRRYLLHFIKHLPPKKEIIIFTKLSSLQKKYYKNILAKNYEALSLANGKPSIRLTNIMSQLRKCVNHPYMFPNAEPEPFEEGDHLFLNSGKFCLLEKLLPWLRRNNSKVLIYSTSVQTLDLLQDYLNYRGYTYSRLDGSVRSQERSIAIERFTSSRSIDIELSSDGLDTANKRQKISDDVFIFLLSTRAGGLGLNLTVADTVIFFDSDWNPNVDLQAQARVYRLGQNRPVKIVRLITRNTIEEIIFRRAVKKMLMTIMIIEEGSFDDSLEDESEEDNLYLGNLIGYGLDSIWEETDESCSIDDDIETIFAKGEEIANICMHRKSLNTVLSSETLTNDEIKDDYREFEGVNYRSKQLLDTLISEESSRKEEKILSVSDRASRLEKRLIQQDLKAIEEEKKRVTAISYLLPNYVIGEIEELDDDITYMHYVVGDATVPFSFFKFSEHDRTNLEMKNNGISIILNCLDDSGRWGRGRWFGSLDKLGNLPRESYEEAGKIKNLHLGDSHLIPISDSLFVCHIIAQHRNRKTKEISGIKYEYFSAALKRLSSFMIHENLNYSVHLARIGYTSLRKDSSSWYAVERLVKRFLAERHIHTYIYYYPGSRD